MPSDPAIPYIVELDSPTALKSSIVGSKAASVADLVKMGATVPPGFAVAASIFTEFISPISNDIAKLLESVDIEIVSSAFEAADAIKELLDSQPTPSDLVTAINTRVDATPDGLAVRSSATAEDLEGASFAGMYDTFLDATDAASVLDRIRDVWGSYYTGRAISYRQRQGIPHESGSMGVLVMELVNADAGGVLFTRDPRDGKDQILINAALGLGEGVVSGEAQADSFTLDSKTLEITSRNVLDKEMMIVRGTAGSTDRLPVPADKRSTPALSDDQIQTVATAATKIKEASGDDRDIEFAVLGDTVHILQSRPVTTGGNSNGEELFKLDTPEEEKLHWRSNRKSPAYPLMIDYAELQGAAEKRSADYTGQPMGQYDLKKVINGYMFAGKSERDPEEIERLSRRHMRKGLKFLKKGTSYFSEVIEPRLRSNLAALEINRPSNTAPPSQHVAYLRKAMVLITNHMNDLHWRGAAGLERGALGKTFTKITGRPDVEASDLLLATEHMTSRLTRRLVGMATLVKSDPWLTKVFESRNYDALFATGNGSRSAVTKFRSRFRSMLKIWGCRNGLGYGSAWKPTDPTWNMRPSIPLDLIGSYLRQDIPDEGKLHARLVKRRNAAVREVHRKIGNNKESRKNFDFDLFREVTRIQFMENHNYLIEQRSNGEFREAINRLGVSLVRDGWIDEADDVYFLRLAELEAASDADDFSSLRPLIISAKDAFAEAEKLTPPEYLGTKPEEEDSEEEPLRGLSEDGQTLHGDPSSAGSFTGTARVILTRTSAPPDIKKGEILVTENTGPDWVPVFPLLGGLVLDSGDNFQHASLISREYGIPCVIQTKDATTAITDGQLITVDGTAGTVTLNPMA